MRCKTDYSNQKTKKMTSGEVEIASVSIMTRKERKRGIYAHCTMGPAPFRIPLSDFQAPGAKLRDP